MIAAAAPSTVSVIGLHSCLCANCHGYTSTVVTARQGDIDTHCCHEANGSPGEDEQHGHDGHEPSSNRAGRVQASRHSHSSEQRSEDAPGLAERAVGGRSAATPTTPVETPAPSCLRRGAWNWPRCSRNQTCV